MNPRLLILLVLAVVLAVVLAKKVSNPPPPVETDEANEEFMSDEDEARVRETQKMLSQRPLPGEEPPVPPELDIQVAVNQTSGKNRLDFWISEAHGYYVETFKIEFWYKENPDMDSERSPLRFEDFRDKYVPAKGTLKDCMEVVPAELRHVGGAMGTDENWGARILWHGRARVKNPDPLPALANVSRCD